MKWLKHDRLMRQAERPKGLNGSGNGAVRISGFATLAICCMVSAGPVSNAGGLPVDCNSYARAYADAHVNGDPSDLSIVDGAMRGAVAGGAWKGPQGARRGALAGGALSVLDSIGDYPGGWQGMYDLAYRLCRNGQSSITHRPTTLGDPTYRQPLPPYRNAVPPPPPQPLAPQKPDN